MKCWITSFENEILSFCSKLIWEYVIASLVKGQGGAAFLMWAPIYGTSFSPNLVSGKGFLLLKNWCAAFCLKVKTRVYDRLYEAQPSGSTDINTMFKSSNDFTCLLGKLLPYSYFFWPHFGQYSWMTRHLISDFAKQTGE